MGLDDVEPVYPLKFLSTVKHGLVATYEQTPPASIFEYEGIDLNLANKSLLANTLNTKYGDMPFRAFSIMYRFETLEKLVQDERALPFLNAVGDRLIVSEDLVHVAAFLPLDSDFASIADRAFELATRIHDNSERLADAFREAQTIFVQKQSKKEKDLQTEPICSNCGLPFNPDDQNPFQPFDCSFHPRKPQPIGNTGPKGDYAELWYFPCCGKRELGTINEFGSDVTPKQTPGCINSFHRVNSSSLFISYSRQDVRFARFLELELKRRGLYVWRDTTDIIGGDRWREMIEKSIQDCGFFLLLISSASLQSKEVRKEVELARNLSKPIVPIIISDCEIPEEYMIYQLIGWRKDGEYVYSGHFDTIKEMVMRSAKG
jgi:hypothetical protein